MNVIAMTAFAAAIHESRPLQVGDHLANLARHSSINSVSSATTLTLGLMECKAPSPLGHRPVIRLLPCAPRRQAADRAASAGPLQAAFLFDCFAESFCRFRV